MKAFDLEKLQSLTLSGEKLTKEIFDALFLNESPYYFPSQQTVAYPFNCSVQPPIDDPAEQKSGCNFNTRNYEIFRGAFETAANCNKGSPTDIISDYQYCDSRFYQGQNYF